MEGKESEKEEERGGIRGAVEDAALSDGGTPASSTLLSARVCVSRTDRDRAEMLYHGRPVLIKPYQIDVSERESGEAATCKCVLSR